MGRLNRVRSSKVKSLKEDPRDLRKDERTSGGLSESCRFNEQ